MAPETYSFGVEPLTCHAWNADRSQIAMSHNNHEVKIYKRVGGKWEVQATLTEHAQRVTGIDWAPKSNRIVTCSADRNAYVWTYNGHSWKPTLVILRINRAATCVKWSPLENKFAVGSSAKNVSVCYFDKENDWWVAKQIKKPIKSTVTSVDWHPNNSLLACGSCDFKARVFSAYIKDEDTKPESTNWGKKMTFGNLMAEFSNGGGGWVHSVSFSADGERLAWVGHDSSLSVMDASKDMTKATIKTKFLPFLGVSWITDSRLVVAGHDCCPFVFNYNRGSTEITLLGKVDVGKESVGSKFSAMNHFRTLDTKATTVEKHKTQLSTLHQNSITQVVIFSGDKMNCTKFSTSGVDGQLIVWDSQSLESAMSGLKV